MKGNSVYDLKNLIENEPLWYQNSEVRKYLTILDEEKLSRSSKSLKRDFKELLKNSNFYISESGYNWDQLRQPIEYAVIHHTASAPTISLRELDVLGLRLYIKQYLNDDDVKNQPLYSGHYWHRKPHTKENMTFISYHYLVRPNGKVIQLTDCSSLLWHAGNLETNRKSIGIALAGKFTNSEPTDKALNSVAEIIRKHSINSNNVFGHREVINKKLIGETECPGNTFLESWKSKIIQML